MPDISLTNHRIRTALLDLALPTPEDGRLHILGVRGAVPVNANTLRTGGNTPDHYDDALVLFGTVLRAFQGSVDPGLHYTAKPLNPDGCAHLLNGVYSYQFGTHRGHAALVQAAPVRYWRDADRDAVRDATETERRVRAGFIGLNIHSGGESPIVGPHSAGCQIIQGGWTGAQWESFFSTCQASGQARLRYYLIDAKDLG